MMSYSKAKSVLSFVKAAIVMTAEDPKNKTVKEIDEAMDVAIMALDNQLELEDSNE